MKTKYFSCLWLTALVLPLALKCSVVSNSKVLIDETGDNHN